MLEIRSKSGKLHFRRWRLLATPWFSVFIHQIFRSDTDPPHDHPWNFWGVILKGKYVEYSNSSPSGITVYKAGNFIHKKAEETHTFEIIYPTTSLVIIGPRKREWGYNVYGKWVHNKKYRALKREKRLFKEFDEIEWDTGPLSPYQGQKGVVERIFLNTKNDMLFARIRWHDGHINEQPIEFLRKIEGRNE